MDDLISAYFNVYGKEAIQENFELLGEKRYVVSEAKAGTIKATFLPKSRERDIGIQSDWNDPDPESLNWGEQTPRGKALARRARAVIGTQRRQDKEVNLRREDVEYLLDLLVNEGYTNSYESAAFILEAMSDEWFNSLIEEIRLSGQAPLKVTARTSGTTKSALPAAAFEDPNSPEAEAKAKRREKRGKMPKVEIR